MHRLVAALLATTLGTAAPTADGEPEPSPAAENLTPAEADAAPEPASDTPGLPSVEDPPGQTPAPEPEPEPAPEKAPQAEGPALAPSPPPPPPPGKDRLGCEFSKSCRQLTITGTVLGSLGLIAVGAGVGLFVRADEIIADEPAYAMSTKPPGLIALTLGSGVVVTSILMLFASHRGKKEDQPRQNAAAWLMAPRGGRF